jgi:hypothetical protein
VATKQTSLIISSSSFLAFSASSSGSNYNCTNCAEN